MEWGETRILEWGRLPPPTVSIAPKGAAGILHPASIASQK
jgi:hypothetical protein